MSVRCGSPSGIAVGMVGVLGLLVPPRIAAAAAPAPTSEPGAEQPAPAPAGGEAPTSERDEVLEQARRLYDEGQVLYSAADYPGAIEKFTAALAMITGAGDAFDSEVRGRLLYNLATAHDRAFNTEGDVKHLRVARELFGRIVDEAEAFGYSESLIEQAVAAREQVDGRLQELEAAQAERDAAATPPPPVELDAPPPAEVDAPPPPGRTLTIVGATVAGLGGAASGLWIAGMIGGRRASDDLAASSTIDDESARVDAFVRGARSNTLALVGTIASGVLITAGAALVVAGQLRSRRGASALACAPAATPGGAAAGCSFRF